MHRDLVVLSQRDIAMSMRTIRNSPSDVGSEAEELLEKGLAGVGELNVVESEFVRIMREKREQDTITKR